MTELADATAIVGYLTEIPIDTLLVQRNNGQLANYRSAISGHIERISARSLGKALHAAFCVLS